MVSMKWLWRRFLWSFRRFLWSDYEGFKFHKCINGISWSFLFPWAVRFPGETYWKRFYEAKKRKEKPLQYYRTM